jgi:hypothetical protein
METYITSGGKEIEIFTDPATAHVKVRFKKGGELPEQLSGLFTSVAVAEVAVRSYILNNKELKKKETTKKKEVDGSED